MSRSTNQEGSSCSSKLSLQPNSQMDGDWSGAESKLPILGKTQKEAQALREGQVQKSDIVLAEAEGWEPCADLAISLWCSENKGRG